MASQPIRNKARKALDRRAQHLVGADATGADYAEHWVGAGRSMVGLAHAVGADINRPTLSRECLHSVLRLYPGARERIANARLRYAARQAEYEKAVALSEAPAPLTTPTLRAVISPPGGPLTLDSLRIARYTGSTPALAEGR